MIRTKPISKEVYFADEQVVKVGEQDIEFLKKRVRDTERCRIRLCAHKDIGNKLHEMFIVLMKETYIPPHKHLNKAESLHVIEGSADAVFFDEEGKITHAIALGEYSSGKRFYYRMDEPVYHTLIIKSDVLVFHEAAYGPFVRSDTLLAPWAPEESDIAGVTRFREQLTKAVERFILTSHSGPF